MEFRKLATKEMPELMELQARSFFFAYDRKKYAEEIANAPWRTGYGVFDGGRLLAGLNLLPFDAWFDGSVAGMGGVGGVASAPEGRGSGNVRLLLEQTLHEMYAQGDVFSFLYPFSNRFYRKFGYEPCLKLTCAKAPLESFREYRQTGRVERFIPGEGGSDPAPIVEVYNEFAARHNLCVDREGWRWHGLLEQDPMATRRHGYVWFDSEGAPSSYVLFRSEPEHGEATEMRVLEACWKDDTALRGLLGFMGGLSSNLKTVTWELPSSLEPDLLWPECRRIELSLVCYGMSRVVNALKAFRLLKKPEGKGSVRVSVCDAILPENTGIYRISWENGEGDARKVKSGEADMECSIAALAQMATGYLSFEQACYRNDVVVNGKAEELGKLFVKKDVYIADKF